MPVGSLNSAKGLAVSYKPLLLCTFTFTDGSVLRVSSDPLNTGQGGYPYGGHDYLARVTNQDIATYQAMSDGGIDHPGQVSIEMADPDKFLFLTWDQQAGKGFKGAALEMRLVMWNVGQNDFSSNDKVIFNGICDRPGGTATHLTVNAVSNLDFNKNFVPPVRFQKRCPWIFPTNSTERAAAHSDPSSAWYECGYSPEGGEGSYQSGSTPFTDCDYTTSACQARGMYSLGRFGGITFAPNPTFREKSFTEGGKEVFGVNSNNEGKYSDFVPFIYGKGWIQPPIMNVIGGGDSTRFEAVLCLGEVDDILNVVVNDVHLDQADAMDHSPLHVNDPLLSWNLVNRGSRNGAPNQLAGYDGKGDPYGSMACITGVVFKRIAGSDSAPNLKVLVSGPKIRTFTGNGDGGTLQGAPANQNPVWQLIDLMTWGPVTYADINLDLAAATAAKCDQSVSYVDANGSTVSRPRFSSSLIIRDRRAIAQVIRGLRAANGLIVYQRDGKIQIELEQTLAEQQGSPVDGSNDTTAYTSVLANGTTANGYVAYHFDESSILLTGAGTSEKSTLQLSPQAIASSPNVITTTFQDADWGYFPDSLTMRDARDIGRAKREVDNSLVLDGIQTYDQAKRIITRTFARYNRGNLANDTRGTLVIKFKTTVQAAHLHVGHIVSVSHEQWGFDKNLFRVKSITPQMNFDTVELELEYHRDNWYRDDFGQLPDGDNQNPRRNQFNRPPYGWAPNKVFPLTGDPMYPTTYGNFQVSQEYEEAGDGTQLARLQVVGKLPQNNFGSVPPPFARQANGSNSGGTLSAGTVYWAVLCATDDQGVLSAPSGPAPIKAVLPNGTTGTGSFTIPNISWAQGSTGYVLFASDNPNRMVKQLEGSGTPASLTVTHLDQLTQGVPDVEFDHFRWDVRRIKHSGVAYGIVASCTSTTITLQGVSLSANEFAGRDCSVIGVDSTDPIPVANFRIASHTATVLTLASGSPSPTTAGVTAGAVLIIRMTPTIGSDDTGNYVEDLKWQNSEYSSGMDADDEKGMDLLCIAGTGAGFSYRIKGNTATRIYIDADWIITPDATSRFIIVEPTGTGTDTSSIDNSDPNAEGTFPVDVSNLKGAPLLITAVSIDGGGDGSWPNINPFREVYVYGKLGTFGGGTGGDTTPPGDVTITVVAGAVRNGKIIPTAKYVPPSDDLFQGVHGYLERPAISASGRLNTDSLGSMQLAPQRIDLGKRAYDSSQLDQNGQATVEFDPQDPPELQEAWRLYLSPYSADQDVPLQGVETGTPTANGVFTVLPQEVFGMGEDYAPRVRNVAAEVQDPSFRQGAWYYKVRYSWTDPQPGAFQYVNFAGVQVDEFDEGNEELGGGKVAKGSQEYWSQNYPCPTKEDVTRFAHFLSYDTAGRVNTYSKDVTPEVSFTVPKAPGSPYVQNFNCLAGWGYGDDGSSYLIIAPYFDRPTDDSDFQCIELRVKLPNGVFVVLGRPGASAAIDANSKAYISDEFWPDSYPVDWTLYAVPVDTKGIPKFGADDPSIVGDSPSSVVTITDPSLGGGEEYCQNPPQTGLQCEVYYPDPSVDGVEQWGLRYKITPPDDPRYAGCTPIAIFDADTSRKVPLGRVDKTQDPDQWYVSGPWDVVHEDTLAVYFPGNDNVPRTNSIVPAVTPFIGGLSVGAQTTGKLKMHRIDPDTIDSDMMQVATVAPGVEKFQLKLDFNAFSTAPGHIAIKTKDGNNIGIGPDGIELNGVPMDKARAGTYDPNIFSAVPGDYFKQIKVDFSLPKDGVDTQLFTAGAGQFKLKYSTQFQQTSTGLEVKQLDAAIINTGILSVGNITGMPTYISVNQFQPLTSSQLQVAWIGAVGSTVGGWFRELYVGGTGTTDAKIYVDNLGAAWFKGTITASTINSTVINATAFNCGTYNNQTANGLYVYKYNSGTNTLVGWVGANGSFFGGWFKELYVGGSDPSTAKIYADSTGNAFFTGTILAANVGASSSISMLSGSLATVLSPLNGIVQTDTSTQFTCKMALGYFSAYDASGIKAQMSSASGYGILKLWDSFGNLYFDTTGGAIKTLQLQSNQPGTPWIISSSGSCKFNGGDLTAGTLSVHIVNWVGANFLGNASGLAGQKLQIQVGGATYYLQLYTS